MALVKDYFEKTKQYIQEYGEKTVVLMQVGAFFEIYGLKEEDDADEEITFENIVEEAVDPETKPETEFFIFDPVETEAFELPLKK
jgi:hypothetical protein